MTWSEHSLLLCNVNIQNMQYYYYKSQLAASRLISLTDSRWHFLSGLFVSCHFKVWSWNVAHALKDIVFIRLLPTFTIIPQRKVTVEIQMLRVQQKWSINFICILLISTDSILAPYLSWRKTYLCPLKHHSLIRNKFYFLYKNRYWPTTLFNNFIQRHCLFESHTPALEGGTSVEQPPTPGGDTLVQKTALAGWGLK